MSAKTLAAALDETLSQLAELPAEPGAIPAAEHLLALFCTLREAESRSARAEAEDLIWALWCTHEDDAARSMMQRAMGAIAKNAFDEAGAELDRMVARWPRWAEAWNKRATLYYLVGRDLESVRDIQRTLSLEPRHFGAISGFGQICLRAGEEHAALMAFELVLRINPNLSGVEEAVAVLRERVARTVH